MGVVKSMRIFLVLLLLLTVSGAVQAQPLQQKYSYAKALFKEGKYNLAQEVFRELIPYQNDNPFSQYASFYYALSAYHQGYRAVARDMFLQIKSLYPQWNQMDEVNLWLAKIYFDDKNYFQGLQALSEIKSSKLQKDRDAMKQQALNGLNDLHVGRALYEKYPDDEIIARKLAKLLRESKGAEDHPLLLHLIGKFRWKKSEFIEEAPPTIKKKVYSVAVLLPFLTSTLEPTPLRKRNQFALDLYEGLKLAVDSLAKTGVSISLRAYDTERNPAVIQELLNKDELKAVDLIIGPLFPEENKPVSGFSHKNRINQFNPVTLNYDVVGDNPYGFLFQPSLEIIGQASAEFLDKYKRNKKCMVFMGDTKRDSILAANFLLKARETSLRVLQVERFTRTESNRIMSILATPTEFDEFKYPKQFSLPKDSLGCIFVASDDPLIYTKVISSVETRKDSVTILGSEAWLDQTSVDFEKYQQLGIVLFAPNYASPFDPAVLHFQQKYIRMHGRPPAATQYTDYARLGYEFMLFAGQMLHQGGVYFQHSMQDKTIKTVFGREVKYVDGYRSSTVVPFVKFRQGELVKVETR